MSKRLLKKIGTWFDKLTTNGIRAVISMFLPFVLSLSKDPHGFLSGKAARSPFWDMTIMTAALALLCGVLLASPLSCGRKGAPIAPEDVPKPAKQSSQSGHTPAPDPLNREHP